MKNCSTCKNKIKATQEYHYLKGSGWIGDSRSVLRSRVVEKCVYNIDDKNIHECSLWESQEQGGE